MMHLLIFKTMCHIPIIFYFKREDTFYSFDTKLYVIYLCLLLFLLFGIKYISDEFELRISPLSITISTIKSTIFNAKFCVYI